MSDMTVKVVENATVKLTIEYDSDGFNPRKDFDHLGTMYSWTRNYYSPDDHNYADPRDFLQALAEDYYKGQDVGRLDDWKTSQLLGLIEKHVIIFPLFKYEHGMIAYSMSTFRGRAHHAEWDSGQVGWVFVTKADVRKEYGVKKISPKLRAQVVKILRAEVEQYSAYANGDVFWFKLERKVPVDGVAFDPDDEDTFELEEVDSCGGYYGWDFKTNGIADSIPTQHLDLVEQL